LGSSSVQPRPPPKPPHFNPILTSTFIMSSTRAPSFPLVDIIPNNKSDDNIIIRWSDGKVQSNVDDAFHMKSQSKGMQHTLDILGELPIDSSISTYLLCGGKALDAMFDIRLPPQIDPEAFLKPSEPPPRMWDSAEQSCKCSISE
jgi:hypothetical protein